MGNPVTTIVGSTIFSIANGIAGTGTWMHKNKLYYKKGGLQIPLSYILRGLYLNTLWEFLIAC